MMDKMSIMRGRINKDDELKDVVLLKNETEFHYILKGLACKYLRRNGYKVNVEIPEATKEEQRIKPDLTAYSGGETFFIEVETCVPTKEEKEEYGSEIINPYKRLVDKMQKYEDKEGSHLVLVVPNIFAFIHTKLLRDFRDYIKSKLGMKVSVHMIDWTSYPARLVRVV